ncbi:DUF6377 domain-containing protein [uncultured Bacteroides sp.]|uniref:DUF6377 domain-containing protein n=1 Tax=uncultured Bacteroides sp. TaxID=162156 RepID=UPI002AA8DEC8|nr:DUF6377 domain-containing protein [uncultured Bacteroides sp.]
MKYRLFLFMLVFISMPLFAQQQVDSLLKVLDLTIKNSDQYEKLKTQRISMIKDGLKNPEISKEDKYRINAQLYNEYESYICDSARFYINQNISIASQLRNRTWQNESMIKKAHILATSGLYAEAMKVLESVQKQTLSLSKLAEYYITFENVYLYQAEYVSGDEYMYDYLNLMNVYRDSVLNVVSEGSYEYIITKVPKLVDKGEFKEAETLLYNYLPGVSSGTRNYSVLTSILAFVYQCTHQTELRKINLIKSAISDVKAVVKENNSIRSLAELLYEEGQIVRADHYVKASMEDANFYNARLRNLQASKMLPIIDNAYQLEKEMQRKKLQMLLIVISILSVFLMIAIVLVIRQVKKLAKARQEVMNANKELHKLNNDLIEANNQQRLTNNSLTEANRIKEEYIGRFLGLCSVYIDKLEIYRRMLNKKAASGKVEELYATLKSSQFIEDELKEFYHNFDSSFLSIFPEFVECFNRLLPEEERILPKQGEQLTTELRIFALIRLGITDSLKIANFLRYSITTIYTYRSKLRNKSICRERFEEEVTKIGSFRA